MRAFLARYRVECAVLLLVALVCVGRAWMAWPEMPYGHEAMRWNQDTDTWLRLTLVRDWLEGGSWYDHGMHRSNAPEGGTQSPWTRPLDVVIALLALPMDGDMATRLIKASLLLPALWALLYVAGVMMAARRLLAHPDAPLMAAAMTACLPLMWNYFGVANADHHAPLAALFAWVVALVLRDTPRALACAGGLLGLMLWMSPEALMPMALALCYVAGRFVWTGQGIRGVMALALVMALVTMLAVMAERPREMWLVPVYDSVSVVHVLALSLAASAASAMGVMHCAHRMQRIGMALVCGGVALAVMAAVYPLFFVGPMVGVHPYIVSDFLPRINEAQPLWKQRHAMQAAAVLWQPVLGCLALALLVKRAAPRAMKIEHLWWVGAGLVLMVCACMVQLRWYYYMAPFLALVLMLVLAPLMRPTHESVRGRWPARVLEGESEGFAAWLRQSLLLLVVLVPYMLMLFEPEPARTDTVPVATQSDRCELLAAAWIRSGGLSRDAGMQPLTLLAPTNLGTQIVYFSAHRIIASNYHREGAAIAYAWESMAVTKSVDLQGYLAQRNVDMLLLCPDAMASDNSVLMRYYQGSEPLPEWLVPVPLTQMPDWRGMPKKIHEPMLLRVKK